MFKRVFVMDGTFENCEIVKPQKTPFPDNNFVMLTENGKKYLLNADYIIFCEF